MRPLFALLCILPALISCQKADKQTFAVVKSELFSLSNLAPYAGKKISPLTGHYEKTMDDIPSRPLPESIDIYFEEDTHKVLINGNIYELIYTGDAHYISSVDPYYLKHVEGISPSPQKTPAKVEIFKELTADPNTDPSYRINLLYWDDSTHQASYTHSVGANYKKKFIEYSFNK